MIRTRVPLLVSVLWVLACGGAGPPPPRVVPPVVGDASVGGVGGGAAAGEVPAALPVAAVREGAMTLVFEGTAPPVTATRRSTLPPVSGTPDQVEFWRQARLVGDAYEITGDAKPFLMEMRFDPATVGSDPLYVAAVSGDQVTFPKVIAFDLEEGYVITEADHYSIWFVLASTAALTTLGYVAWQARSFTSNEAAPWTLIDVDHPKIKGFIGDEGLTLPTISDGPERFAVPGYDKKFKPRPDTFNNRVVHLTGKHGADVLAEKQVACWDLTTLFGSILYTLDPGITPRLRFVKGALDGGRHSWIEVAMGGRAFVVNTAQVDRFELIDRDVAYREQKLAPAQMYTKDAGSLVAYDATWFVPYLGKDGEIQAQIDVLKAKHRALQGKLQSLNAKGSDLTRDDEREMTHIRDDQHDLYEQVQALQAKLSKPSP